MVTFRSLIFLLLWSYVILIADAAPCQKCDVTLCQFTIDLDASESCSEINQLSLLPDFAKNDACKQTIVRRMCGFLYAKGLNNTNRQCDPKAGLMCQETCQGVADCISLNVLVCNPNATGVRHADPVGTCVQEMAIQVEAKNTTYQRPCPDPAAAEGIDAQTLEFAEIGGLAFQNHSLPPFPLRLVARSTPFSSLFPAHCFESDLGAITSYPRAYYTLVMSIIMFVGTGLFWWRRHLQPIKARQIWLSILFMVILWLVTILLMHIRVYVLRSSCNMLIVALYLAAPAGIMLLAYRAIQLLYMYRWAEARLTTGKTVAQLANDWYFRNRWMIQTKGLALWFALLYAVCLPLFFVAFFGGLDSYGPGKSLADSGRCLWWDLNQDVVDQAKALGVTFSPNPANPEGYLPYSAKLDSCTFCDRPVWELAVGMISNIGFTVVLAVAVWRLRKINDLYFMWTELVVNAVPMIIFTPIITIGMVPEFMDDFTFGDWHLEEVCTNILLGFNIFATILLPLGMTYTSRFKFTNDQTMSALRITQTGTDGSTADRDHSSLEGHDSHTSTKGSMKNSTNMQSGVQSQSLPAGKGHHRRMSSGSLAPPETATRQLTNSIMPGSVNNVEGIELVSVTNHEQKNKSLKAKPSKPAANTAKVPKLRLITPGGVTALDLNVTDLLADPVGLEFAKKAALEMFCTESIQFWVQVKQFRKYCRRHQESVADCFQKAQAIYETFIRADSPMEVNISGNSRTALAWLGPSAATPTKPLTGNEFDPALLEIKRMLNDNLIPRFKSSKYYPLLLADVQGRYNALPAVAKAEVKHSLRKPLESRILIKADSGAKAVDNATTSAGNATASATFPTPAQGSSNASVVPSNANNNQGTLIRVATQTQPQHHKVLSATTSGSLASDTQPGLTSVRRNSNNQGSQPQNGQQAESKHLTSHNSQQQVQTNATIGRSTTIVINSTPAVASGAGTIGSLRMPNAAVDDNLTNSP